MNVAVLAAWFSESYQSMKTLLITLTVIFAVLLIGATTYRCICKRICTKQDFHNRIIRIMYIAAALVLICLIVCFLYKPVRNLLWQGDGNGTDSGSVQDDKDSVSRDIQWEIIQDGNIVNHYWRNEPIFFDKTEDYFALPGIATFRGNHFRNSPTYGTATVTEKRLEQLWNRSNGTLNSWPGCGWTGQPLMVQWDEATKAIMNIVPEKKTKENLVEVIYATLDGNIYFFDLDDGKYTRNPINLGMNFKGSGSLDPRGYPIMYVGSGDYLDGKAPRMYIISLIDGTILYEYDGNDPFSLRPHWTAFDSSPMIDGKTDTLIWPGENGILYTIKLNTHYNKSDGKLTVAPAEIVKTRYQTNRSNDETYWLGYESSAVIVGRYLYISENGGMFFCIDLDTMELVWAQDTKDDSNSTPVFEWDGQDGGYIYTAPSLHWTQSNTSGTISVYKLDARTGEIIWEHPFDCKTVDGISGGVQSTPLLGRPGTQLEGLIIYTVARCPGLWDGKLIALDTETGNTVWEKTMNFYTWSSPIPVYSDDGNAYIIVGDSNGQLFLRDSNGELLSVLDLGSNIEASPAMFNNTLVVGTRGNQIFGIQIK